jgi:hypothetical protein
VHCPLLKQLSEMVSQLLSEARVCVTLTNAHIIKISQFNHLRSDTFSPSQIHNKLQNKRFIIHLNHYYITSNGERVTKNPEHLADILKPECIWGEIF